MAFFLQGLFLGVSAAASPGPFQTFIIGQTLEGGRRNSLPIAFAPLISDGPIILLATLLLGRLPPFFLRLVSFGGGVFLLYISWGLWQTWRRGDEAPQEQQVAPKRKNALLEGVLMNAMSPGPYTFWTLVTGPLLLQALRVSWLQGGSFLAGFYTALIGSLLAIVVIFDQARRMGPKIVRFMLLASIFILTIFALSLIYQAFK